MPCCGRIEVAGSIRRQKAQVNDIEICAIPLVTVTGVDLLGDEALARPIDDVLTKLCDEGRLKLVKGFKPYTPWKYAQFEVMSGGQGAPPICKLDLFLADKDTWGCIFTIRTGPAEFNRKLVTAKRAGGLCPAHLRFRDGRLCFTDGSGVKETPEEHDVFRCLGLPFIPPEQRR